MTGENKAGDNGKDATAEAAYWLVALEDAPDDAELRTRFEAWLDADPAHAAAWADTSDIYELMAETAPVHRAHWDADALPPTANLMVAKDARAKKPRRRHTMAGVAAMALAASIAFTVVPSLKLKVEADYITDTAELKTIDLPDGSTVRLAPGSAISVDADASERRIKLVKGEAFFEVAPDAARPFRVESGGLTTTVLGTAFDVRLDDDGAAVSVSHGKVGIDFPGTRPPVEARLRAGDWIRVGWDGRVEGGKTTPDEIASWRQGQLVVRGRALSSVVDDLRRYHSGVIVIPDAAFGERRISGVYNISDPAAALRAMAGAHGGKVYRVSPWVLVVTGG